MKTLKKILIGLGILLLLAIIAIIFMPKSMSVSSSKTMDVKASTLYNIVSDLEMEKNWSPWVLADTSMVTSYGEVTQGLGASSSWVSENSGSGSAKYIEVVKNEKIVNELDFGSMGGGKANFTFEPDGSKTKMTWTLDSKTNRPFNVMNFLIKKTVKKSYEEGLGNLEKIALKREKEGIYRGLQVNEELLQEKSYVTNRDEVPFDKIPQFYAQNLGHLFQKIQKAGVEMDGHPSGLFYSYDMVKEVTDMAAGIPISEDVNIKDAASQTFSTQKALVVDYYGDYSGTKKAHTAIDEYLRDRGMHYQWPVIEEYVTDPSVEPNPEKWLTKVIYYLSE